MEQIYLKTEMFIKVHTKLENQMDMVNINGQMEVSMLGILETV